MNVIANRNAEPPIAERRNHVAKYTKLRKTLIAIATFVTVLMCRAAPHAQSMTVTHGDKYGMSQALQKRYDHPEVYGDKTVRPCPKKIRWNSPSRCEKNGKIYMLNIPAHMRWEYMVE